MHFLKYIHIFSNIFIFSEKKIVFRKISEKKCLITVLREHISHTPGASHLDTGLPSSPQFGPRVGYLAGPLDNAELAHGALADKSGNAKEGEDLWLIICAERSRTPCANFLVELYSKKQRLLELKGDAAQQAAEVRTLNPVTATSRYWAW
jgi:hypothetical protein